MSENLGLKNGGHAAAPRVLEFPHCPLFLSFQVGIFLAKEENNRLRQEKQLLKKQLEEVGKRVAWEDPMMVTQRAGTGGCWPGCRRTQLGSA